MERPGAFQVLIKVEAVIAIELDRFRDTGAGEINRTSSATAQAEIGIGGIKDSVDDSGGRSQTGRRRVRQAYIRKIHLHVIRRPTWLDFAFVRWVALEEFVAHHPIDADSDDAVRTGRDVAENIGVPNAQRIS